LNNLWNANFISARLTTTQAIANVVNLKTHDYQSHT
jgi:hypothetical protein